MRRAGGLRKILARHHWSCSRTMGRNHFRCCAPGTDPGDGRTIWSKDAPPFSVRNYEGVGSGVLALGRLIWDQACDGLKRRRNDTDKSVLDSRACGKHVRDLLHVE